MPTCLLVRHGRTTANAAGILAGWMPGVDLDEAGRAQAAALGRVLGPARPVRILTSPLPRCVQTARIVRDLAWPGAPVRADAGLGECRYGSWTGRPLAELAGEPLWQAVQHHPSGARFPDGGGFEGESIAAMAARTLAAIAAADRQVGSEYGPDAIWLAVSHGDPIKAALADACAAHLDAFQRFTVAPASVSVVRYTQARPFLLAANVTAGGLADLPGLLGAIPEMGVTGDAAVGGGR